MSATKKRNTSPSKTDQDLPLSLKEKLLELGARLPESKRAKFVASTSERLGELASEYSNTIIFAVAGWVLGEVIDNMLTINVPFTDVVLALTCDQASDLGMCGGVIYGFLKDREKHAEKIRICQIVGEELRRAIAT